MWLLLLDQPFEVLRSRLRGTFQVWPAPRFASGSLENCRKRVAHPRGLAKPAGATPAAWVAPLLGCRIAVRGRPTAPLKARFPPGAPGALLSGEIGRCA